MGGPKSGGLGGAGGYGSTGEDDAERRRQLLASMQNEPQEPSWTDQLSKLYSDLTAPPPEPIDVDALNHGTPPKPITLRQKLSTPMPWEHEAGQKIGEFLRSLDPAQRTNEEYNQRAMDIAGRASELRDIGKQNYGEDWEPTPSMVGEPEPIPERSGGSKLFEMLRQMVTGAAPATAKPVPKPKLKTVAATSPAAAIPDLTEADPLPGNPLPPAKDYSPAAVDWQARADTARDQESRLRLAAGMARARNQLGSAFAHHPLDASSVQALEKETAVPGQQLEQDQQLDALMQKASAVAAEKDPNSTVNRRYQDAVIQGFPGAVAAMGGEKSVRALTRPSIEAGLALREKANKEDDDAAKQKLSQDQLAVTKAGEAEKERNDRENNKIAWARLNKEKKDHQSAQNERAVEKNKEALGKITAKYAPMNQTMQEIEQAAPGFTEGKADEYKNKVSWTDRLAAKVGAPGLAGKDAQALLGLQERFHNFMAHLRSGSRLTKPVLDSLEKEFNTNLFSDPATAAKQYETAKRYMYEEQKAAETAYSNKNPDLNALQDYENQGGATFRTTPVFKNLLIQSIKAAGKVPMLSPDGQIGGVDPDGVDDAIKNGHYRRLD